MRHKVAYEIYQQNVQKFLRHEITEAAYQLSYMEYQNVIAGCPFCRQLYDKEHAKECATCGEFACDRCSFMMPDARVLCVECRTAEAMPPDTDVQRLQRQWEVYRFDEPQNAR